MRKLSTRCSTLFILATTLLTGCPGTDTPTTTGRPAGPNVQPIPSVLPPSITPTPVPSSIITNPTPFPSGISPGTGSPDGPGTPDASVSPNTLTITTSTLPTAVINFAYNSPLQVVNGSGSYRWSITSGNLPAGLSLDPNTGQVFGTPTTTGTFSFQAQVIDNQTQQVARQNLSLLVSSSSSGLNDLAILTSNLPTGTIDRAYSRTLEVSGGTAPFSWDITAGALPDGLSLNTSTGEISGTPTLRGEETFTVRISDGRGQTESRTLSITINRTDTDISILSPSLPVGIIGTPYNRTACGINFSGTLQATGGDNDYRWSVSKGSLPAGLSLSTDGEITGSPTTAGSSTFTLKVQDGEDNSSSKVFTIDTSTLAIHRFTPGAGGEDLRVVLFGENLGAAVGSVVSFGDVNSTVIGGGDVSTVGDCDQLVTHLPANAQTGTIEIKNGGNILGSSTSPFLVQDVVISEVFFSPDNNENQFVELTNRGSNSVMVAGWQLQYTPSDSSSAVAFTLPAETPALQPGRTLTINLAANGATSATNVYTGTNGKEMRLDPLNGTPADALTQVALCAGSCNTDSTDTSYRDYLQFGANGAIDGGVLENNAVSAGLWTNDSTLDITNLVAPLDTVSANAADPNAAHYGVFETGNAKSGLLVTEGNAKFDGYTGEVVVYYTPRTGASVTTPQRIKRGVTGTETGANRVRISSALSQANIQSTNTGAGQVGNGILVDNTGLLGIEDYVNVIAGGTLRTVLGLQSGPRVELDQVLFASIQASNASDGTVLPGFTVGAGESAIVSGANTVSITVRSGQANEFTVTRNLVSTPSTNQVVINQAVATAPVAPTNAGDGNVGSEITLTSTTNFATGDKALYNGRNCDDGTVGGALCTFTIGGSQVRLDNPVATANLSETNTGDGSAGNLLEVDDVDNISAGSTILVNGQSRTIVSITPAFGVGGKPKVQLNQPLKMTLSNTTGDGTAGNGVQVTSTAGFATGNLVSIRGQQRTITIISGTPARLELSSPVVSTTVDNANTGDGTAVNPLSLTSTAGLNTGDILRFANLNTVRTITNIIGNNVQLNTPLVDSVQSTTTAAATAPTTTIQLANATGFSAGDAVKFPSNEIRTIASVAGNTLTLTAPIGTNVALGALVTRIADSGAVNLVPNSGDILPIGSVASPIRLNLVPKSGNFTMVPIDPTQDRISRIPTTGSIFLAPREGILRKYLSIQSNGSNDQSSTDYRIDQAPNKGQ